ncbi:phage holin family protein [Candidatus Peregrinibacteria bacterium]|nr:phage holin family protein [Candidatus Peregrinibacteria bacterium]
MLKRALLSIFINGLALYLLVSFLSEITGTGGIKLYIIGGLIIGILNAFVKPVMKILSLPFVVITAGLFLIVINAVILYLTEWIINTMAFRDVALHFIGLGSYLVAAIILGIINWISNVFLK